ncbi:primase C-terminal domain-containing protein [Listeria fleischmannii]|uniref:primase C-terminal domain-containing protein n=1 Tax=Listeria fleischmannii TaxID=1069827 RepID=UPI0016231C46|nr:primase C-terminal domain-containing protein [Listeria fleischmannii]MBC1420056.1 plasmid replication protein [Listeria fleischmannii]
MSHSSEIIDLYTYSAVISTVVHEGITAFSKRNSRGVFAVQQHFAKQESESGNRKGVQFVVRQKEDLQRRQGVRGFIVTSQEALIQEVNQFTHWTPNTYRFGSYTDSKRKFIKGHAEENLQQINTYVIDVDTQHVDVAKMLMASMKILNQTPTFILQTTHGFQLYFVLTEPVFISNAHNFKSLRVAKKVAQNLKHAFAAELPNVDRGCNDFGFFRAPNLENVVFDNLSHTFAYEALMTWSKAYSAQHDRPQLHVVEKPENVAKATDQKWFADLIQLTNIQGRKGQYGRNNALFTLGLACYSSEMSYEEAFDLLDEFNTNLQQPVSLREMEKTLKSAYSGKYQGANLDYIQGLLETYDSGTEMEASAAFIFSNTGHRVFRKHRKAREARTYSHFEEWEADLETYIQKHLLHGQTFLEKSQRDLSEETQIPLATLKKLLKQSKRIISKVEGKGRSAVTLISTNVIVVEQAIRHALTQKQAQKEKYLAFLSTFSEAVGFMARKLNKTSDTPSTQNAILRALPEGDSSGQEVWNLLERTYRIRSAANLDASDMG